MLINSNQQVKYNYSKICNTLLGYLPERQKDVLNRRFGLVNAETETLQSIGDDFGITRERVRQIEREGLSRLSPWKKEENAQEIFSHFSRYFSSQGGLKREDLLLGSLGGDSYQNHVFFLLTLGDEFHRFPDEEISHPFWSTEEDISARVQEVIKRLLSKFEAENRLLLEENILPLAQDQPTQFFYSAIEIARDIEKGPLGEFGLVFWPEIKPRGVRDVAYLVLKKGGSPLHFRQIAEVANSLGDLWPRKTVLPQTVHNELIRDERFVLVGRGLYALREWGYNNGTVREVILHVLKEANNPLCKEEIVENVLKQRHVKENTVVLNLHNKKYFLRTAEGKYLLK